MILSKQRGDALIGGVHILLLMAIDIKIGVSIAINEDIEL